MMKRLLIRFGLWLATLGGWEPVVPPDILALAREGVEEQNTRWPSRDGEAKRAAVYRTLINVYPDVSKRLISRAIEEAVCSDS